MTRKRDSSDAEPPERPGALVAAQASPCALDAHGFDPADYKWVPVLRKPRADGWTPQKQVRFIEILADTGSVTEAAREVGMSVSSAYRLRRAPGAEAFAAAWDAAIQQASKKLVDIAFERALGGVEEPVFDKEGRPIAWRRRYNDRLLMFLLRAHQPGRYRHAHQSLRYPNEDAASAPPPLAEALLTLEPVAPSDPHLLMPPDKLEDALEIAAIMDGALPHWQRDPAPAPGPIETPLGEEFERELEAAKVAAAAPGTARQCRPGGSG